MGLSEREQQLLDDMERRFYQSEADVMHASGSVQRSFNTRSVVLGILVVLAGIGVLIAGVSMQQLWLGLIGFAMMVGGAVLASTRSRIEHDAPGRGAASAGGGARAPKQSINDRLNRRWDERMDGDR